MSDMALRSAKREMERFQALSEKLYARGQIGKVVEFAANVERGVVGSIWKGGVEPPPFDEFCVMLDGQPMFDRQVDAWEVLDFLRASNLISKNRTITELVLEYGKGAGKGFLVAKFICYIIYIFHQFAEPPYKILSEMSGKIIAPSTMFGIVNVAPNEDLAKEVFYTYLKHFLMSPLMLNIPTYPVRERWGEGTGLITFPQVNVRAHSKTSKSSGFDGLNTLIGIIDEGDAFMDNSERSNADEVHDVLRRTAIGRFGNMALVASISYPRFEEGYMRRLAKRGRKANEESAARGEPPMFFVDKATTHEMRPDFDLESPEIREEFQNDPHGASAMYLCVDGDTLVNEGVGLVPIREANSRIFRGVKETIRLRTEYGYELIATTDHRLLTPDGQWCKSGEFSIGDSIAITQYPQCFGEVSHLPIGREEGLAELAGQLVGDGYVSMIVGKDGIKQHTTCWTYDSKDQDLIDRQVQMLRDYGFSPAITDRKTSQQVRLRTKAAHDFFLNELGISHAKAQDKRVPHWVFTSRKYVVASFLRGLFEADGCINHRGIVSFASTSERLAKEVQQLLLMFGITSRLYHTAKPKYNDKWKVQSQPSWIVTLSQRRAIKFWEEIGFLSERKKCRCSRKNPDRGYKFPSDGLYYLDKVVSIESTGEREVYDLYDQPDQRFFANGFVAHNCEPMTTESSFIEFKERIPLVVDTGRVSSVDWHTEVKDCSLARDESDMRVCLVIDALRPLVGRNAFLGVDGGVSGDSYCLSVYSYGTLADAHKLICPECGTFEPIFAGLPYKRVMEKLTATPDDHCGSCGKRPVDMTSIYVPNLLAWYKLENTETVPLTYDGKTFSVPIMREDVLIEVQPLRKHTSDGINAVVDFESIRFCAERIVNELPILEAGFDQWQTVDLQQYLRSHCKTRTETISMSTPEQLKRGKLYKKSLYAQVIRNLENEKRDREVRRLQLKGNKLDHPPNPKGQQIESKDLYDSESIALYLGVLNACEEIAFYL